ncbi:MAG: YraN family protein, partial [Lachnospiraceae bacterium]|nr:YraN family protein [Lachnospiraceae bacterium]
MNRRKTGSVYEDKAADLIVREGGRILDRNYRNRMGEVDIVADDAGTICFVEVKYRKNDSRGTPAEAVGIRKQFTICRVADHYRMAKRLSEDRP